MCTLSGINKAILEERNISVIPVWLACDNTGVYDASCIKIRGYGGNRDFSIIILFKRQLSISEMGSIIFSPAFLLWPITFALLELKRTFRDLWQSTEIFITWIDFSGSASNTQDIKLTIFFFWISQGC